MIVIVDAVSGDYLGWGEPDTIGEVIQDFAGKPVIALAPETGDGVLDGYVDHYDGEDCWAGIKYIPEIGKFQVEFCCDSSSDLDPVYCYNNYYEAVHKANSLVTPHE